MNETKINRIKELLEKRTALLDRLNNEEAIIDKGEIVDNMRPRAKEEIILKKILVHADENYNEFLLKLMSHITEIGKIDHKFYVELVKLQQDVPEEEIDYLNRILKELTSLEGATIEDFIKRIMKYIRQLKGKNDKKIASKLYSNPFVKKVLFWIAEEKDLKEKITEIKNDNSEWKYFRKQFIAKIKPIARKYEYKYGDYAFGQKLLRLESSVHENRKEWIGFLESKLHEMENGRDLKNAEHKALEEFEKILRIRLEQLNNNKLKIKKEFITKMQDRISYIEKIRKKAKIRIKKTIDEQNDILANYASMSDALEKERERRLGAKDTVVKYAKWKQQFYEWDSKLSQEERKGASERIDQMIEKVKEIEEYENHLMNEEKRDLQFEEKLKRQMEGLLESLYDSLEKNSPKKAA